MVRRVGFGDDTKPGAARDVPPSPARARKGSPVAAPAAETARSQRLTAHQKQAKKPAGSRLPGGIGRFAAFSRAAGERRHARRKQRDFTVSLVVAVVCLYLVATNGQIRSLVIGTFRDLWAQISQVVSGKVVSSSSLDGLDPFSGLRSFMVVLAVAFLIWMVRLLRDLIAFLAQQQRDPKD